MHETVKLVVDYDYAGLLFKPEEGKNVDDLAFVVDLERSDPRFTQIPKIQDKVRKEYQTEFILSWDVKRKYSSLELDKAKLLRMLIKSEFEPAGEEMGTAYDDKEACPICGANGKQLGLLKLKKSSVPKKDIARTIAGEVIVSTKTVELVKKAKLRGWGFAPIIVGEKPSIDYCQLICSIPGVNVAKQTVAGLSPFDLSDSEDASEYMLAEGIVIKEEKRIYKCPRGHVIGLNILSEVYVEHSVVFEQYDLVCTKQKVGVRRGLLRPEPLYLCTNTFRRLVEREGLKGFGFEVAHIV